MELRKAFTIMSREIALKIRDFFSNYDIHRIRNKVWYGKY